MPRPLAAYPRVYFCGLLWLAPREDCGWDESEGQSESEDKNDCKSKLADFAEIANDHAFSIIHHGDDKFQLVSGYKSVLKRNGKRREGVDLGDWLKSGGRWSGREGFDKKKMNLFLDGLEVYASSEYFNLSKHEEMFGDGIHVETRGRRLWNSFSFCELKEEAVEGYGCRKLAEDVKRRVLRDR